MARWMDVHAASLTAERDEETGRRGDEADEGMRRRSRIQEMAGKMWKSKLHENPRSRSAVFVLTATWSSPGAGRNALSSELSYFAISSFPYHVGPGQESVSYKDDDIFSIMELAVVVVRRGLPPITNCLDFDRRRTSRHLDIHSRRTHGFQAFGYQNGSRMCR